MIKNKILKPISSILILVVLCFTIFKGPNFIYVKYYYWIGYSKQKLKNLDGAIDDFTKVLSFDKTHRNSYVSRGSAYMDLKKYDKAIEDYSKAIELNSETPDAYAYRGRAFYELRKPKLSLKDYDKAISLDIKFGYAYLNRALLRYTLLKDKNGGCEDLHVASKLGMSEADEHLESGVCE